MKKRHKVTYGVVGSIMGKGPLFFSPPLHSSIYQHIQNSIHLLDFRVLRKDENVHLMACCSMWMNTELTPY